MAEWDYKAAIISFSENDTIYWVDMGLSTISRAKRDQTWREDVVTNGIGRVEGITVDWIAGPVITQFMILSIGHGQIKQDNWSFLFSFFFSPIFFYREYLLDWSGLWCDWGGQTEWLIPLRCHFPGFGQTQSYNCPPSERVRCCL